MILARPALLVILLALVGCAALPEEAAWRVEPLRAEDFNSRGLSLAGERRYDEAIVQFQNAVALDPNAAYLHNNLGYAYLMRGLGEQALAQLEEADRLAPGQAKTRQNLAAARARASAQRMAPALPQRKPESLAARAPADERLREIAPGVFELRTTQAPAAPAPRRKTRLEVANGNGARGLARTVARQLASHGVATARLANERPYRQARTEVRYRAGYELEAGALASLLPGSVVVPAARLAAGIDVRIVLGADRRTALAAR